MSTFITFDLFTQIGNKTPPDGPGVSGSFIPNEMEQSTARIQDFGELGVSGNEGALHFQNYTAESIMSGGPYDGMQVVLGTAVYMTSIHGQVAGFVAQVRVDKDGSGGASQQSDTIGYIIRYQAGFGPGATYTTSGLTNDGPSIGIYSLWDGFRLVCFTGGTKILTPSGERAIETLSEGNLVNTLDNGPQPVRWIGHRRIEASELARFPQLRPIRISPGALGVGYPEQALVVSPQHRILLRSDIARRMFGVDEVLVSAKQLLEVPGVDVCATEGHVEYWHFLMDRHEVVIANGVAAESLLPGPEALKALSPDALQEIFLIFPELEASMDECGLATARMVPKGRLARKFAARSVANSKPVYASGSGLGGESAPMS